MPKCDCTINYVHKIPAQQHRDQHPAENLQRPHQVGAQSCPSQSTPCQHGAQTHLFEPCFTSQQQSDTSTPARATISLLPGKRIGSPWGRSPFSWGPYHLGRGKYPSSPSPRSWARSRAGAGTPSPPPRSSLPALSPPRSRHPPHPLALALHLAGAHSAFLVGLGLPGPDGCVSH